jgi:apolipoprotein N-acyltransferase
VRAADEGLLTASDAEGRLIAQKTAASSGMTVLIAALPLGPGQTLYTRIGDAFAWCVIILLFGIGVLCARPKPNYFALGGAVVIGSFVRAASRWFLGISP